MNGKAPRIENAPGLQWRPIKFGWQARWKARADIVANGYEFKSLRLWESTADQPLPSLAVIAFLQDQCNHLQNEMLAWRRGITNSMPTKYDGTWATLIESYRSDPVSSYHKARYRTRIYYDTLCRRIKTDHGPERIADFKVREAMTWHDIWSKGGHIAMAHSLMGMLRTLVNFGADFLEDDECSRASGMLRRRKFETPKPRTEHLTSQQADAIRAEAHRQGRHSIALAQALQFDLMLRQKDAIGEWVPVSEPGVSDVIDGNLKWLRGVRWEEIDENMILTHTTSKRQKVVQPDLRNAPMVLEEFARLGAMPPRGPIVINEITGQPYSSHEFRRNWRKVATAAGVPKAVRNMDSRAGAITEATDAGVDLEHIRHAATHSDTKMTARYSRSSVEKARKTMAQRIEFRNKKGTTP